MLKQPVEYMCGEDSLAIEALLEIATLDGLAILLAGVQVQADLARVQLPNTGRTTGKLVFGVDAPSIEHQGISIEVEVDRHDNAFLSPCCD